MLQMDPYYRTLTGFIILIEQEFIYAGHPFHTRTGAPGTVTRDLLDVVEDECPVDQSRHVTSKSHRSPHPFVVARLCISINDSIS